MKTYSVNLHAAVFEMRRQAVLITKRDEKMKAKEFPFGPRGLFASTGETLETKNDGVAKYKKNENSEKTHWLTQGPVFVQLFRNGGI